MITNVVARISFEIMFKKGLGIGVTSVLFSALFAIFIYEHVQPTEVGRVIHIVITGWFILAGLLRGFGGAAMIKSAGFFAVVCAYTMYGGQVRGLLSPSCLSSFLTSERGGGGGVAPSVHLGGRVSPIHVRVRLSLFIFRSPPLFSPTPSLRWRNRWASHCGACIMISISPSTSSSGHF